MIFGYGGFNIPMTPQFKIERMLFLENGGIYAIANLRGGGEYGEEWHEAARADVEGTRRKQADRIARKHMAEAGKLVEQKDRAPFYAALSKALHGYMANKFGLGLAQLNQALVREKLADLKDGNALADDYVRLITACDMARFAPVEDRSRKELFGDAVILIGKIEQDQNK